jgi:hypothetical protein
MSMYYWWNNTQDKIEILGQKKHSRSFFFNTNTTKTGLGSNLDIRRETPVD